MFRVFGVSNPVKYIMYLAADSDTIAKNTINREEFILIRLWSPTMRGSFNTYFIASMLDILWDSPLSIALFEGHLRLENAYVGLKKVQSGCSAVLKSCYRSLYRNGLYKTATRSSRNQLQGFCTS